MTRAARDRFGNLRCRVLGCRTVVRAPTGLMELDRLRRHFARAHLARLSLAEALELRAKWEREAEAER